MEGLELFESTGVSILVSLDAPHIVLTCGPQLAGLLGYTAEEIVGRSIKILHGPRTETSKISSAIKRSSLNQTTAIQSILYGRSGLGKTLSVTCTPHYDAWGVLRGCAMDMLVPESPDNAQARMECLTVENNNDFAKVLISAQHPHIVIMANQAFTDFFGFFESQVVGRSLRIIHSPSTDVGRWNALIRSACAGLPSCAGLVLSSSACQQFPVEVTASPTSVPRDSCYAAAVEVSFRPLQAACASPTAMEWQRDPSLEVEIEPEWVKLT